MQIKLQDFYLWNSIFVFIPKMVSHHQFVRLYLEVQQARPFSTPLVSPILTWGLPDHTQHRCFCILWHLVMAFHVFPDVMCHMYIHFYCGNNPLYAKPTKSFAFFFKKEAEVVWKTILVCISQSTQLRAGLAYFLILIWILIYKVNVCLSVQPNLTAGVLPQQAAHLPALSVVRPEQNT